MNRSDFQQLAEIRIREAKALLDADFPAGAYYLAGYSVECALKACIAKQIQEYDFPDKDLALESYQHNLDKLRKPAGLLDDWKQAVSADPIFRYNWDIVRDWSEQSRYEVIRMKDGALLAYARQLIAAIESTQGGILPWIKQRW